MNDCVFCKIVRKELPAYVVYEDGEFMAFLSIVPLNPGHALVIPKKHYRWVWDVPNIGEYYQIVQKIANAQTKAFETDKIVSLVIGEEVAHAHVWLVPRFEGDGHGGAVDIKNVKRFSKEEMEEFAEKIRSALEKIKPAVKNAKMTIYCTYCGTKHIDEGPFAIKPHRRHLCMKCKKEFLVSEYSIGI